MFTLRTLSWPSWALFVLLTVWLVTGQDSTSHAPDAAQQAPSSVASKPIAFDEFVDLVVRQESRLTELMRGFKPIIETYIQEEGSAHRAQRGVIPNGDDYFLSRLNLTENSLSLLPFADEETWNQGAEKNFVHVYDELPFKQAAFAQALFPDFGNFDRQNYSFEFVRWEDLGDLHCAAVDVTPHGNSKKRGFVGRIWVEDRNHSIVRFKGTFTSRGLAKRAFHFDSWRLNTQGDWWLPAYVYTEEWKDLASHQLWFRAQTRVWDYARITGDHLETAKHTGIPEDFPEPKPRTKEEIEDAILERTQAAGLLATDGEVNRILETVVNNLLITNNLDIPNVRCRVLLTMPLESFVIRRTIVVSRGLLDVLPDEATLAAVLSHELAHVVLGHAATRGYSAAPGSPSPDSQVFDALDFHFDRNQEKDAINKGKELFSRSPYKDKSVNVGFFLRALDASSSRFPVLLHGRFSNDFRSSNLVGMEAGTKHPHTDPLNQISALPIGSRILLDPWSNHIEMLKMKLVPLTSPAEKIPFQVTPFLPHLMRLDPIEKAESRTQP